jgi:hypothetical protein
VIPPAPSAPESKGLEEQAKAYAEKDFWRRRDFKPDVFTRKDAQYGAELRMVEAAAMWGLSQGREAGLLERETFLAEHDENVRLHTELTALKAELYAAKAALEKIAALDSKMACYGPLPGELAREALAEMKEK